MQEIKRILVLDDHANLLEIIKEVLIYEHFQVISTSCSDNVISMAHSYQPDLIIIDCHLAGCNGAALCSELKANVLLNHIPVIICSAYIDPTASADTLGGDAVIAKPFNMDDLVETINSLLMV